MDVIDLCDSSDDDETDTRDTQNRRLDTNQSFHSTSTTTAARVAAVAQRPRSISSASNSPVDSEDDVICLSDDKTDEEPQVNNDHIQRTSLSTQSHNTRTSKPMSAREKTWAAFQEMRREAAKKKAKAPPRPASAATRVSSPPTQPNPSEEKRKRKRSNSKLTSRKKPSAPAKPKPPSTNTKRFNNSGQSKKPTFLEQGLRGRIDSPGTTNQQNSPKRDAGTDSLPLLSSLAPFQAAEVYDGLEPLINSTTAQRQDRAVAPMLKTTKPPASAGATLNAAIEIDSDDDDDDYEMMQVSQQQADDNLEVDQSQNDGSGQRSPHLEQRAVSQAQRATNPADATTEADYHPLLQLASTNPAGQQHDNGDRRGRRSSNTQGSRLPDELMDSGSVALIRDHRFNGAGKLAFEVEDHYGATHRGILLEDLKVDAPALLSSYILGKAKGKLAGKAFRQWAVKTQQKLTRKALRHMARQERMAREVDEVPEPENGCNQPATLIGGSSHAPVAGNNKSEEEEREFEMDSVSSQTPGRKSPGISLVPDSEARDCQIRLDGPQKEPSRPLVTPNTDCEQEDDATREMTNESPHPPEGALETSFDNDSEDSLNCENSLDGLQFSSQEAASKEAFLHTDLTKTAVPDLNEEGLQENSEDIIDQMESNTSDSNVVGSRPAYTAAEVAVEMEEEDDDDDEILIVDVKAPSKRDGPLSQAQHQSKTSVAQTPLDKDDDSMNSVQSASAPSGSTRHAVVGSGEAPIDVDNDDSVSVDTVGKTISTLRDYCTQQWKKRTKSSPPTSYSFPERRFIFHQKYPRRPPLNARHPTPNTWSYGWSCDAAMKEQERLFQASAAKMRSQTTARVAPSVTRNQTVKFEQVMPNIAEKYPLHWQFSDHSARLGVPEGSSESVIKKQYRRLALLYHPDKSRVANTATKFQNVTEAYRALIKSLI